MMLLNSTLPRDLLLVQSPGMWETRVQIIFLSKEA